MKANWISICN